MSFDVADVPLLPGWILVAEAADILGLSKQTVHTLIRLGKFKTLHRLGSSPDKSIYVIRAAEVRALATERNAKILVDSRQDAVLGSGASGNTT